MQFDQRRLLRAPPANAIPSSRLRGNLGLKYRRGADAGGNVGRGGYGLARTHPWQARCRAARAGAGAGATGPVPGRLLNKTVNSAFGRPGSPQTLKRVGITTLIVTGGETNVCVLATVMATIDYGFRIVLPTDACSTKDSTHDALLQLYRERFSHQVEATTTAAVLDRWR